MTVRGPLAAWISCFGSTALETPAWQRGRVLSQLLETSVSGFGLLGSEIGCWFAGSQRAPRLHAAPTCLTRPLFSPWVDLSRQHLAGTGRRDDSPMLQGDG